MKLRGKVSWFGGPDDTGVSPSEGLAFIYSVDDQPDLFLPEQPPGTTGLARRLDPNEFYIALRWPYDSETKEIWREALLNNKVLVRNPANGKQAWAFPADWGPHEDTGRLADISPGLLEELSLETDDEVEVVIPTRQATLPALPEAPAQKPLGSIVISSGHGLYVRGASGLIDEVDEARRVVERVADDLRTLGLEVKTFHDDTSKDQSTNLHTIVDYHNKQTRDLDVSVHFNANEDTDSPMGTECLYVSQEDLAARVATAISECGLKNRGPKERTDLYFLNNTEMPAILIEVCFVDSSSDVRVYENNFSEICTAIAGVLSNENLVA